MRLANSLKLLGGPDVPFASGFASANLSKQENAVMRLAPGLRSVFAVGLLAVAGLAPSASHAADPWPTRTVRLIVPFPAGSANDAAARLYAEGLSKRWAKPVV